MDKCLVCGKELEDEFVEGELDNPLLFCSKYHRRSYRSKIIDDIHELSDSQLQKLREVILDGGLLSILVYSEDFLDFINDFTERLMKEKEKG